jgi:hypothetical protein
MPDSSEPTSDPSSEQEHYSLDEMMQRLKERGHEEGELVTRADGTVAIKVKKRKRRSKQPIKEQAKRAQRMRLFQIGTVFTLLTIVLATAVGMLFYYNSNAFREATLQKISEWTGANVELAEFSVTPNSARAGNALFQWPEGNYLRSLQLTHPSAVLDITSFIGNRWGGTAVLAKSGKLVFSDAKSSAPKSFANPATSATFPFAFSSYRCEKLDITGLRDNQSPWFQVEATEASLIKTSRGAQTRFTGGMIKLPGMQKINVDRGSIYFELGQMRIEKLRLKVGEGTGSMELENSIELYSPTRAEMQVMLENFPLDVLMGQELDVIFSGFVDTPSNSLNRLCSFTLGDLDSFKLQLGFRGSERDALTVRNLPFLRELSTELQNPEYARQFAFTDRVEGELIRTANSTKINELRLEKKGHFAIRGQIEVIDRILSGTLQVGLPTELLWNSKEHGALKRIFTRQQDGFLWCSVELSGQPGKPMDNFTSQYQRALEQESASPTAPPVKKPELDIEKELEN